VSTYQSSILIENFDAALQHSLLFQFSKTLPITSSTAFTVLFSVLVALCTKDLKLSWFSGIAKW
jgi:hypothetical protein